MNEDDWKEQLTPEEFRILREKGTEPAFTGKYCDHKEKGTYTCAACGTPLFSSEAKYDSGSGWPSFFEPIDDTNMAYEEDTKLLTPRTEVMCQRCKGHLGHVFDDGPAPTGKRFCINSTALKFKRK